VFRSLAYHPIPIALCRFMMVLRDECTEEQPGNPEFWAEVKKEGRSMSLISKPEAANNEGKSAIPESVAAEVSF
jgi:ATP-dependent DNA helicase 2 subunit 2